MSRPICVECRVEYSCKQNDVLISDPAVGGFEATYWHADMWECPGCKHQTIVGRGKSMLASDHPEAVQWAWKTDSFEFNHNLPTEKKENVT